MRVSVVMATYSGEKIIGEQLDSILYQLHPDDELIISDDGSADHTLDIIRHYQDTFSNIRLVKGPGRGVVNNFNNAICFATGDVVFISDQDDIWKKNKVRWVKRVFEKNLKVNVVMHDVSFCDSEGKALNKGTIFGFRNARHGFMRNMINSTYYGSCMAVRKDFINKLLPMPDYAPYDQYIGLCAEYDHCSYFLRKELMQRREHGDNQSQPRDFITQVITRVHLYKAFKKYQKRRI